MIEDFLIPGEEIKFHGGASLIYGGRPYELIITDRRLLLYGRRGRLFKKDDIVSQKVEEVQNIRYSENGILRKEGVLQIDAKTRFSLVGHPNQVKAIYQQILRFF